MSEGNQDAHLAWDNDVQFLMGDLLTLVDAAIPDPQQRKALKDLVRKDMWAWANGLGLLKSESQNSPNFVLVDRNYGYDPTNK